MKGLTEDSFYKAVAGSLILHTLLLLFLGRISLSYQPTNPLPDLIEVIPLRLKSPSPLKPPPSAATPPLIPMDTQRAANQSLPEKVPLPHLLRTNTPQGKENQPQQTLRTASRKAFQKGPGGGPPNPPASGPSHQRRFSNPPKPSKDARSPLPSPGDLRPTPGGPLNLGSPSAQGEDLGPVRGTTPVGIPPNVEGQGTGSGPGEGPGQAEKPQLAGGPPLRTERGPLVGNRADSGEGRPGEKPGSSADDGGDRGGSSSGKAPSPVHQNRLADRKEPELIHFVPPTYPLEAREEGVEGSVTLEYLINEKGEVKEVRVVKSSGDYRLDRSAVEAVKKWRYLPAVQDGIPRGVKRRRTIEFRLPQ